MRRINFLLFLVFLSQPILADTDNFKYRVVDNYLEVFGYKLPTNHLPKGDSQHFVGFSQSPNSQFVVILSYLHLEGKGARGSGLAITHYEMLDCKT